MPEKTLTRFLSSARQRRWLQTIIRRTLLGTTVGCSAAIMFCLISSRIIVPGGLSLIILCIAVGVGLGLISGLLGRESLKRTALMVDEVAHLKDRAHSALQFSSSNVSDWFCRLQIQDAAQAITQHSVKTLFPWRWPREGTWAAFSGAIAMLGIVFLPVSQNVHAVATSPPVAVLNETAELAQEMKEWEQVAEELDSDELRELTRKLKDMLGDMQKNADSVEQAMLQLARMSAAVDSAAAQFNPLVLQDALQDLGKGLTGLEGFEQLSSLLSQEMYDRAVNAAQSIGEGIGSGQKPLPSSGGLTESRMGQLAAQAEAAGLSELSESLSMLQKAIRNGSRSECKSALNRLGNTLSKYANRLKVGRAMRAQLAGLNECKQCMGSYCKNCKSGNGDCQGGNCKGIKFGMPNLVRNKSKSPSQSAGTAIAMNKYGQETELRGNRSREHVSGQIGHGEFEKEVEVSPEGQQTAAAAYRKVYAKYQKLSDAVIAEEAVPLAHRQTIKRYFELIHPDRVDPNTQLKNVQLKIEEPQPLRDKKDGVE